MQDIHHDWVMHYFTGAPVLCSNCNLVWKTLDLDDSFTLCKNKIKTKIYGLVTDLVKSAKKKHILRFMDSFCRSTIDSFSRRIYESTIHMNVINLWPIRWQYIRSVVHELLLQLFFFGEGLWSSPSCWHIYSNSLKWTPNIYLKLKLCPSPAAMLPLWKWPDCIYDWCKCRGFKFCTQISRGEGLTLCKSKKMEKTSEDLKPLPH